MRGSVLRCTGKVFGDNAAERAIGNWNKQIKDGENTVAGECYSCTRVLDDVKAVNIKNGI